MIELVIPCDEKENEGTSHAHPFEVAMNTISDQASDVSANDSKARCSKSRRWLGWIAGVGVLLVLSLGVLAFSSGATSRYFNFDSISRRKGIAAHLNELADRYRQNPEDLSPLLEIQEIATGDYDFGRSYSMGVLADLSKVNESVVPFLGHGIVDSNPYVRHSAGAALSQIGKRARLAKADLIRGLTRFPNEGASSFAADALLNIGDNSPEVLEALEKSAKAKDSCDPMDKRKIYRTLSGREMP